MGRHASGRGKHRAYQEPGFFTRAVETVAYWIAGRQKGSFA